MSLQAKLEAIRKALETKIVACPCVEGPACSSNCSCYNPIMSGGCLICGSVNYSEGRLRSGHTAHRIPDPTYAPLLDVMREPCTTKTWDGQDLYCIGGFFRVVNYKGQKPPKGALKCERCGGTGYVTRNWDGLRKGALAGELGNAIDEMLESGLLPDSQRPRFLGARGTCTAFLDKAALNAVLLALVTEVPDA